MNLTQSQISDEEFTRLAAAVAARLRDARRKSGLNQSDFALWGGVSRATQALFEGAKSAPNTDYLIRLAGYGVDVSFIVSGRSAGDSLGTEDSELLGLFQICGPAMRHAVRQLLTAASDPLDRPSVHSGRTGYRHTSGDR